MAVTRSWKVYGVYGHRQRESFAPSRKYDWSCAEYGTRIVEIINSDQTGTNEYTIVKVTRDTAELCEKEIDGQISDGIFENCRTGDVVEIFS